MVLPRVLYVRVVEMREIELLSESARNWNCKIRLQSVKLCEHRICGTAYVRYLIHTYIHTFIYTFNKEKQPPKATSIKGNPEWFYYAQVASTHL